MTRISFPDSLRSELEPSVSRAMGDEQWGLAEADRAVALSQAISLRRIADAMNIQTTSVIGISPEGEFRPTPEQIALAIEVARREGIIG